MGDLEQVNKDWSLVLKNGMNEKNHFIPNIEDEALLVQIISSFANTTGGDLFVGVNEKSKIIGVNPHEVIGELQDLFTENDLSDIVEYHTLYISHFILIRIHVAESLKKKAIIESEKNVLYFRIKGQIVRANKVVLRYWRMNSNPSEVNCKSKNIDLWYELVKSKSLISLAKMYKESPFSNKEVDQIVSCLLYKSRLNFVFREGQILFESKINEIM